MCGIFGYVATSNKQKAISKKLDNAAKIVFEGLKRLEYRGYDSWGLAVKSQSGKSKIIVEKHVGKIGDSKLDSKFMLDNSTIALGHTRWATHGGVTVANAHPHLDCRNQIAVVHNGIIENFQQLKKELIDKGHSFKSQTDTEVFAHLIEEYMDLGFIEAVKKAFKKLNGRNAFVVLNQKDRSLLGVRDGSPLIFGVGDQEYFLASDTPAFLEYTKDVVFLNDKQGVVVKDNKYELFNLDNKRSVHPKVEKISWSIFQAEKGKYEHFLLKEILEQPATIAASAAQSATEIKKLAQMIADAFGSFLVACGTASYAALYGTYVFSAIAKKHINWAVASEFADLQHFLTPKSLVIAVSQSGETADTLEAVKVAKQKGAKTVAIVNVMGSSLMRLADHTSLTNAGPEIAVVSTKAFSSQLSALLLLAYATANNFSFGKSLIEKTAQALEKMLDDNFLKNIKRIAKRLKDKEHIYVIGKGQNYPIALEAALKIKEASYIHGEGFAAGELKHGVITLIDKGTPCIVLFGNDQDRDYSLSSAIEMKSRGGLIIGVGPQENEVFDEFIKVADIAQASAIINTLPVQLLAYYLAVLRGNNPDRPRNLAKSVTVK